MEIFIPDELRQYGIQLELQNFETHPEMDLQLSLQSHGPDYGSLPILQADPLLTIVILFQIQQTDLCHGQGKQVPGV